MARMPDLERFSAEHNLRIVAIKDLIYSVNPSRTELFLSHFVDSEATLPDIGGAALRIRQETRYPWDGDVTVTFAEPVNPATVGDTDADGTPDTFTVRTLRRT